MKLSPKDIERLKETQKDSKGAVSRVLKAIEEGMPALERRLSALQDVNSTFPETVEFLRARGFEHVSELDEKGEKELAEHLRKVLAEEIFKKDRKPSNT